MTKYAKIQNDVVVNVIEADEEFFKSFVDNTPGRWVSAENKKAGIGFYYNADTKEFTSVNNLDISRTEFLKACVAAGIISSDVAEEAASGLWPKYFNTFLEGIPTDKRIEARAAWADSNRVRRDSDILSLIAQNQGITALQLDNLFDTKHND